MSDVTFGSLLQAGLTTKGETVSDLATVLGVSRHTVAAWCAGERLPQADHLVQVCRHFGWVSGQVLERAVAPDAARRRADDGPHRERARVRSREWRAVERASSPLALESSEDGAALRATLRAELLKLHALGRGVQLAQVLAVLPEDATPVQP